MNKTRALLLAIVLIMTLSNRVSAQLVNGWNFIRPANCVGIQISSVDYAFIYPTTGGVLTTADPTTITAIAPLCATGHGFFVYLTNGVWTGVSIYPGIS
jgi:hypothetical protein